MKFIKSNLAKKLIIILIALMIFNIAIPREVNAAWNFSGILMKPITSMILSFLVSIDVQIGLFMLGADIVTNGVGRLVEDITADAESLTVDSVVGGVSYSLGKIFIGPDTIFAGGVSLLNANIFKAEDSFELFDEDIDVEIGDGTLANMGESALEGTVDDLGESVENAVTTVVYGGNLAGTLKRGIATTYVVLRNICAMIMLAGLIFTGIRVLVTSNNPSKKAQWLQLVYDWLIGMVLLIFSHVIMYGIFWISDEITVALKDSLIGFGGLNFTLVKTCLISFDSAEQVICLILLGYLIYLTIVFAIAYFKRLLWVCVLIVIAPIVSIMYAFGSQTKRIYSDWLREYITTVLVQPFHLIVYYTLVSIPLNMVSAGTLEFTGLSTFKLIYALGAISFIRPAERYIRNLFGMNKGIAEMASYDSGKQTLDAIGDVAKKIASVIAIAATAGAAAPAVAGELGATEVLANPMIGELNPDNLLADIPGTELYGNISRDPFHEDYFAGDANFDNDLQNPPLSGMNKMNEEELQNELNNMGLEEGTEERAYMESDLRLAGHGRRLNDAQIDQQLKGMGLEEGTEEYEEYANKFREAGHGDIEEDVPPNIPSSTQEPNDTMVDEYLQDISDKTTDTTDQARSDLKNRENLNNINASNVNITAANITMKGKAEEDKGKAADDKTDKKDSTDEASKKLDKEKEDTKNEDQQKLENEKNIGIEVKKGETEEEDTPDKDDFLTRRKKDWNAITDFTRGESSVFESINKLSPDSKLRKIPERVKDSKLAEKLREGKHGDKVEGFVGRSGDFLRKFDELGGFKELHAGFNTVRDGFFVGGAPGDWKETNRRMEESRKGNIEQAKFNIVNNDTNITNVINKLELEEKLRKQYPDKEKYPDARIKEMAKEKAKDKIKSMSDTYVPLGIKDPVIMLELEDDRKQFGMTPTEAIQQRVKYEKFNIDQKNISYINEHLNVNATSVKQAVEPAREYYNNGYQNVGDLSRVHELTSLLRVTPEFGMKLDKVLNKKGPNINLNLDNRKDLDDKQKEKIKTFIEDRYINNKETK